MWGPLPSLPPASRFTSPIPSFPLPAGASQGVHVGTLVVENVFCKMQSAANDVKGMEGTKLMNAARHAHDLPNVECDEARIAKALHAVQLAAGNNLALQVVAPTPPPRAQDKGDDWL